ncbi:DnaD domain protein [Clostridium butyricum]
MDLIVADIEVYSAKWLMDAAEHSVKAGKINYNYVQGILRNWKAEGRKENKDGATSKSTKNTESEGPKYNFDSLYGK